MQDTPQDIPPSSTTNPIAQPNFFQYNNTTIVQGMIVHCMAMISPSPIESRPHEAFMSLPELAVLRAGSTTNSPSVCRGAEGRQGTACRRRCGGECKLNLARRIYQNYGRRASCIPPCGGSFSWGKTLKCVDLGVQGLLAEGFVSVQCTKPPGIGERQRRSVGLWG